MNTAAVQVLIIEDDEDLRDTLAELVTRAGYTVRTAHDGAEALAFLKRAPRPPCCVLLDLMMPVMTGWELLEVMSGDDQLAALPVIVLSAQTDQARGAVRVLKKPLTLAQVLEYVQKFCGASCPSR